MRECRDARGTLCKGKRGERTTAYWLFEDLLFPFLTVLGQAIYVTFSDSDRLAISNGVARSSEEDDLWFRWPIASNTIHHIWLAADIGSSVIFFQADIPTPLIPRVETVFAVMDHSSALSPFTNTKGPSEASLAPRTASDNLQLSVPTPNLEPFLRILAQEVEYKLTPDDWDAISSGLKHGPKEPDGWYTYSLLGTATVDLSFLLLSADDMVAIQLSVPESLKEKLVFLAELLRLLEVQLMESQPISVT